ncbi:MAG: resolvase protein [uncultured bacterium (gcode 4)]|uniref:Resolvase protein n=1 Tax=uncultured bacterium (gcode 4) TaxID=1234023 RepID=K2A3V3_9BACT|nr:MAG: resolvase protein [uncultured bacterium (gcode 4)]
MRTNKVAFYIRTSTPENEMAGHWADLQLRELRSYTDSRKNEGWQVSEDHIFIDEGYSGASATEKRPALAELKEEILMGGIDTVLITSLDRLFRKTPDMFQFRDFLNEHKVNLVSKKEKFNLENMGSQLLMLLESGLPIDSDQK